MPFGSRDSLSAPRRSYPQMGLADENSKDISSGGLSINPHNSLELGRLQELVHEALAVAMPTTDAAPPSWVVSVQSKKRTSCSAKALCCCQFSSAAGQKRRVAFTQATLEIAGGSTTSPEPCSGGVGQNMPDPHVPVVDEQQPSVHVMFVAGPHSRLVAG